MVKLVDAFYIGGTKNGAPLGEALVIINDKLKDNFRFTIKHNGAMLAKGFVVGICFEALFENDLFFDIAKKQNELARKLNEGLIKLKVPMYIECESNQIFPIFNNSVIEKLSKHLTYSLWEKREKNSVIRFVTNYLNTESDVEEALKVIKECLK